ncbi:MAG: hypothetical protein HYU63_03800 [Armatimonadetes bacterium]|nr:hypothetical protein [Armatimonadota bacterium]
MDGFLNINKPGGLTSHDVIKILRKILKIKKIGHLGTLDPQAEGVLPIALGSSTRLIEFIEKAPKIYQAEITLGIKTDTGDAQGKILERLLF